MTQIARMELIVAVQALAGRGGPQTYALTVAEQLARLGHHVTLFARDLGALADVARERRLNVTARVEQLPEHADGVIASVDRSLATELAARYRGAARIFVVHGIDEIRLPPALEGVVSATVALDDRSAARAAACVGAGEVVRLRQPVDLERFGVRGQPAEQPQRALLLSRDPGVAGAGAQLLDDAWSQAGIECEHVGFPDPHLDAAEAMHEADIVVGRGRSIVEAMASGRPAYVFDHAAAGGWVTPESYERIEAAGFSGRPGAPPPDAARLRADLAEYRPELGRLGHDLVRVHHDASGHAADLVALLRRLLAQEELAQDRSARHPPALLSEARPPPEVAHDEDLQAIEQWYARAQAINAQLGAMSAELESTRATLAEAAAQMQAIRESRRFRLGQVLVGPAQWLRRRARRRS